MSFLFLSTPHTCLTNTLVPLSQRGICCCHPACHGIGLPLSSQLRTPKRPPPLFLVRLLPPLLLLLMNVDTIHKGKAIRTRQRSENRWQLASRASDTNAARETRWQTNTPGAWLARMLYSPGPSVWSLLDGSSQVKQSCGRSTTVLPKSANLASSFLPTACLRQRSPLTASCVSCFSLLLAPMACNKVSLPRTVAESASRRSRRHQISRRLVKKRRMSSPFSILINLPCNRCIITWLPMAPPLGHFPTNLASHSHTATRPNSHQR